MGLMQRLFGTPKKKKVKKKKKEEKYTYNVLVFFKSDRVPFENVLKTEEEANDFIRQLGEHGTGKIYMKNHRVIIDKDDVTLAFVKRRKAD